MALSRMPRVGEFVRWAADRHTKPSGPYRVDHVYGNLVWLEYPSGNLHPFIAFFPSDGTFNTLAEIVEPTP